MSAGGRGDGALAIVLHTHMPYVEGFGTWPFGEEWLFEAIASSYLPLLALLDQGAPLTLSLTPVLCDQLEGEGVFERCAAFYDEVRRHTHHEDAAGLRAGGHDALAAEVLRSWGDYEHALARWQALDGDLLGAFAPHAQWTSAATHAVLPLLATDAALTAQVNAGIDSHRARFGAAWRGGFWLPECAHAPWIEPTLIDAGVHAACVELTACLGPGSPRHLRPILSEAGLRLVPIDRATVSLVWSERGYPAHGHYRDYHHHTIHHHQPWANDGSPYDHARAVSLAQEHAADFVSRTRARLGRLGGLCPAAVSSSAPSTPSSWATGGTRAPPGSPPWSPSASARALSCCASTTRWSASSPPPTRASPIRRASGRTPSTSPPGARTTTSPPGRPPPSPTSPSPRALPSWR